MRKMGNACVCNLSATTVKMCTFCNMQILRTAHFENSTLLKARCALGKFTFWKMHRLQNVHFVLKS